MNGRVTAADAMHEALAAKQALTAHEDLCAERYANIHSAIGDLKTIAKWAAGGVVSVLVALIAWMAVQLYTANNDRLEALEAPHAAGK